MRWRQYNGESSAGLNDHASGNSEANCLTDRAKRENISALMHSYDYHGGEVTRKFLSRKYENPDYENLRGIETCTLHAADFLYRIESN
ncbi:hypothetical protein JXJ21_21070 [candidate division KSB1 bacterium]|nr:hypothetical protein [candidate division KSB1 bacterium]